MSVLEQEILQGLAALVQRRAALGNPQSKHGQMAAEQYEIFKLTEVLGKLMESS